MSVTTTQRTGSSSTEHAPQSTRQNSWTLTGGDQPNEAHANSILCSSIVLGFYLQVVNTLAFLGAILGKVLGAASSPLLGWITSEGISAHASAIYAKFKGPWKSKVDLVGKVIVLLALVVSVLALWPAFAGASDGKRANILTQWTARKDYFEFCETHDWQVSGCNTTKEEPLGPPPILDPRDTRHGKTVDNPTEPVSPILHIGIIAMIATVVSLRLRPLQQQMLRCAAKLLGRPQVLAPRARLVPAFGVVNREHNLGRVHADPPPIAFGTSSSFEFNFRSNVSIPAVATSLDNSSHGGLRQRKFQMPIPGPDTRKDVPPPLPPPRFLSGTQSRRYARPPR
uniref:WGS project CBMF000000000 data, contig CS5834_c000487 n=1 Tax=Fusarium pseudograminearum CS5834 TaxID=1318459 RepID=A0A096PF57_FUSPS|nr:unnamed protein product [Fusarium pseudograminearum CS5834]